MCVDDYVYDYLFVLVQWFSLPYLILFSIDYRAFFMNVIVTIVVLLLTSAAGQMGLIKSYCVFFREGKEIVIVKVLFGYLFKTVWHIKRKNTSHTIKQKRNEERE